MKVFALTIILSGLLGISNLKAQTTVKWHHIERAQTLALQESRPLFIDFTAKWCGWCKKMDQTTFKEKKVVSKLNESFYAVKVDFDSQVPFEYNGKSYLAKELAEMFGIQGLPTMVVVSADLQDYEPIKGYQKAKPFLQILESNQDI